MNTLAQVHVYEVDMELTNRSLHMVPALISLRGAGIGGDRWSLVLVVIIRIRVTCNQCLVVAKVQPRRGGCRVIVLSIQDVGRAWVVTAKTKIIS